MVENTSLESENKLSQSLSESALVILVPEAEILVKNFRDKYDSSAAAGMPAHITLLYPFKRPHEIESEVIHKLKLCLSRFTPFSFEFVGVNNFPHVLYMDPEPNEQFCQLTLALWDSFPETPPYGGKHSDIKPHLTVAHIENDEELTKIADEFSMKSRDKFPLRAQAVQVVLMDNVTGRWQARRLFNLGHSVHDRSL